LGLAAGNRKKPTTTITAKLKAKYRNPKDPSQTWHGGKGPKPKWIKELIANGGNLEDVEIRK